MTQQDPPVKLSVTDFAAKIKSKYPQYKEVDDLELTKRIVDKYPQYAESVEMPSDEPTAEPLQEGFAGPSSEAFEQQKQIKKEGQKKQEQELEALAESAGFRKITDDVVEGWVENAIEQIQSGEVATSSWDSGVEQLKGSLMAAIDQAALADPATYISPEAMRGMMMSKEGRESIKKMREGAQKIKRLQKEGYFKEGGMLEQAMQKQLLANEQFKQTLRLKGLDPEATITEAFQKGGIMKGLTYIKERVLQQSPQLAGAFVGGAAGGQVLAGGAMGASAAGGDIIGKVLQNRELSDEDRTAALAKGILEGTAESILSPVSALGGQVSKRVFGGVAKEVAKQGGKKGLMQAIKKVFTAGLKEGVEEAFVETMSPFIDEAVKQLYQDDADFDIDKFLSENFGEKGREQILESFVIGFATGAPVGGVQAGLERGKTKETGTEEQPGSTQGEQQPITSEEVTISPDKDVDFHVRNIFTDGQPVEDVEAEVTSYLESLDDETKGDLAGKEQAFELAVEAYNERLKNEQEETGATEGEQPSTEQEETGTTETPVEATEEGGSEEGTGEVGQRPTQAGGGRTLTDDEKSQIESEYNVTLNDNIDGTYEIEPNDDTANIEDAKARINEIASPAMETEQPQAREEIDFEDFTNTPKSEITSGKSTVLYRGNVAAPEGLGKNANIMRPSVTNVLGGEQKKLTTALYRASKELEAAKSQKESVDKRLQEAQAERDRYYNEQKDPTKKVVVPDELLRELEELKRKARFLDSEISNGERAVNDWQSKLSNFERQNKEAAELGLIYLSSQPKTAVDYATQQDEMPDAIKVGLPKADPNIDEVTVEPQKVFDTREFTNEEGIISDPDDGPLDPESFSRLESLLGLSYDELGQPTDIFQLFRGDNAKKVVAKLKELGYDSVVYNEMNQENFIVLDKGIIKGVKTRFRSKPKQQPVSNQPTTQEATPQQPPVQEGTPTETTLPEATPVQEPVVETPTQEPTKVQTITYRTTDAKSYVIDPTDEKSINEIADKVDPERKTDLREIPKLAAAFKRYTNGASVVVHENQKAAELYLRRKHGRQQKMNYVAGFHDPTDNTIHLIAKPKYSEGYKNVISHEYLHPFIGAIMRNNPQLAADLYSKISALPEFDPIRRWADANYVKRKRVEEGLVEFFSQVATGRIEIEPTTKDKIIQYINEILESIGVDIRIDAKRVDIKQFAASLAESMRTGREIVNPFERKGNTEQLNRMVDNNNANLNPRYDTIERVYNNMPEKRRQQLAPVMDAAKLAQEIVDGKKGDLRAKIAAIPLENIESLNYVERIYRYLYMGKGHNTKEQAQAFLQATAEFAADPVRSGLNFYKLDMSDPSDRSLKSFIERKDANPEINDEDIVKAIMVGYGLNQADALEVFQDVLARRYVPPATSFERTSARIFNAVARKVMLFTNLGIKSNGDPITLRELIDYTRLNYLSDRFAPLRTARYQIEKYAGLKLPDNLDAAAYMDTAQAKAKEYGDEILKRFRGVGNKVGGRKHFEKSFLGRLKAKSIEYQEANTFLFMQHVPEFLARKNDFIRQKRQVLLDELADLNAQLQAATTKKEKQRLNARINKVQNKLASDEYTTNNALGTIERNGQNVPLTAALATTIKNELEAKHPDLNKMANDFRVEMLEEYYQTLSDYQMIEDERIDHLRNGTSDESTVKWDYYVPMNVIDEVALDPNELGYNNVSSMSAEGLSKLTAGGFEYGMRDRKDPLTQLVVNTIAVREQAEVNEGYRALARLLKQYGSKNWSIAKARGIPKVNSNGQVTVIEATPGVKDNNAVAYINQDGKKSYIIAKNVAAKESPLFMAIQRGEVSPGWFFRLMAKVLPKINRYMRNMITSLNVAFGFAQIPPDFFDAMITTAVEVSNTSRGRAAAALKYTNNYRKAIGFFMSGMMNDNSEVGQAWKTAKLHGMPMSWSSLNKNNMAPYEYLQSELMKLEQAEDAKGLKKARAEAGQALDRAANLLSDMNDAMENVARLAAFMTAQQYGMSPTQAAAFGKDVTVNFEAKGRRDSGLRMAYLFYGAAVKGIARTARTAKLLGVKGSLAMIGGAALVRAYQYAMMDEDELDQYIQNDYTRQNRFILPIPGTDEVLNMKAPYSVLRIYNSIGQGIVDMAYDKRTPFDVFWDLMANTLTVFDPVAGSSSPIAVFPTATQPLIATYTNLDYKGDAIVHDMVLSNSNRNADAYTKNTNPIYIAAADQLYNVGLDVAPGYLEYLMDGYITLPAVKNIMGSADEIFMAVAGERASKQIADEIGVKIPKELLEQDVNYERLFPLSKAFFRPTKEEELAMWNLYEYGDRKQLRGFTREQFNYAIKAYKIARSYRLPKQQLNRIMNGLEEKFPEFSWREYERAKEYYDVRNKPYEDRAKLEEERRKRLEK